MKLYKAIFVIFFALMSFACWSAEQPAANTAAENQNTNTLNTAQSENPYAPPINGQIYASANTNTNTLAPKSLGSPTETLRVFSQATINKNAGNIMATLSQGSRKMIEDSARAQNSTVEAILLTENENSLKEIPEMRNEKISGDTATVEVKNRKIGGYDKMPLVKENGEWKIALDQYVEIVKKKVLEQMPNKSSNSNVNHNGNQK